LNNEFSYFPIHVTKKHGLSPVLIFIIWIIFVGRYYLESLAGAHGVRFGRSYVNPVTHMEFIFIAVGSALLALLSLLPLFTVKLDVDETGIRKTIISKEHFYPWSDIVDIAVTDSGGFRGRGGFIRFIRRGETKAGKLPDLSPGMFGGNVVNFSAFIREGIARWGPASVSSSPSS